MQTLQAKPLETTYWDFTALSLVEKLLVYLKYQPTWDMVYKPSKNQHCTSRKPAKPAVKNFLQNIILLLEVWEQSFPVLVWRENGFLLKNKSVALFQWLLSLTVNSSALVAREVKRQIWSSPPCKYTELWGMHYCMSNLILSFIFPPTIVPSSNSFNYLSFLYAFL